MTKEYRQHNKKAWDRKTALHLKEEGLYTPRVERLLQRDIHAAEDTPDVLDDIKGARLLHLQCHVGIDSFLWAHRGAQVTALDFSPASIAVAQSLEDELQYGISFVEADVYDARSVLTGYFDVILSYYGVLCWLPDLRSWAKEIASLLSPGGYFYLADGHPFADTLQFDSSTKKLIVAYPYANAKEVFYSESKGSYGNPDAKEETSNYQWMHSLEDILMSFIEAGLSIEYLHEFPYCFYNMFYEHSEEVLKESDGKWFFSNETPELPLSFSLKVRK